MLSKAIMGIGLGIGLAAAFASGQADAASSTTSGFNQPGNILITDQFNNRVIEVDRNKNIVWSFGSGDPNDCSPGAHSVIAPNDAERLAGGLTLIAGTGTSSCPDNRVIVVDQAGNIVFQYGQAGVAGSGPNQLNVPVFAIETPSHTFLITDQANNRIINVDKGHHIVYKYDPTSGPGALNNPNSAELLQNDRILIADENNSRVIVIDPSQHNKITFSYSDGLNVVAFASRLPNGDTLIADSGNNRIVEINDQKQVVFTYATNTDPNSNPNPNPTGVLRLITSHTIIADQFNNRAFIIDQSGNVLFQYGQTNVVGNGPDQLNAPYSAVVISDYTGVTHPPAKF